MMPREDKSQTVGVWEGLRPKISHFLLVIKYVASSLEEARTAHMLGGNAPCRGET